MDASQTTPSDLTKPFLSDGSMRRVMWSFVAFGVAARLAQYLICAPLWHDELALVDGLLQVHQLADVLRPLPNAQIAPPWFCAFEWLLIQQIGCSEYVLRFLPLAMSVVALLGFTYFCRRALPTLAATIAVAIFAVSNNLIEYAAEVKPYSGDVAATVLLAWLIQRWWQSDQVRYLGVLTVLAPLMLGLSFPTFFIYATIAAVIAPRVVLHSNAITKVVYATFLLTLGLTAATLYVGYISHQSQATMTFMSEFWSPAFFPWATPVGWPGWFFSIHTGELMAYPFGGNHGASAVTALAFVVGVSVLIRQRQYFGLAFILVPFGLGIIASALGKYPYGYLNRTSAYLGPIVIVTAAIGTAPIIQRLNQWARSAKPMWGYVIVLYLLGASVVITALVKPSRVRRDWQSRAFARWFWNDHAGSIPTICALTDLGIELPHTVDYRCHQRMYSGSHRSGVRQKLEEVLTDGGRARVVFPEDPRYPSDKLATWEAIRRRLPPGTRVVSTASFKVNPGDKLLCPIYHVYEIIVGREPSLLSFGRR